MKIASERKVLHIYGVTEEDRKCLTELGYEYVDDDVCGNETWDKEENYYVGEEDWHE